MPRTFPSGSFRRRAARYGETVTFLNEDITVDTSTDWDDESVTTAQVSPTAVVQITRAGLTVRDVRGDEVDVDALVFVHDDELGGFSIAEGGEGGPTKVTPASGGDYMVVVDRLTAADVHEVQVTRV